MKEPLFLLALILYLGASLGMLCYGLNCYVLLGLFARRARETGRRQHQAEEEWRKAHPPGAADGLPKITTQIPLYNELNVAERVIRAVAAFDYPTHLHQIQVCDDSTDETCDLVDRVAAELRAAGLWIDVFRRETRSGYKAGALREAMASAHGEFIAIFDSDFVPRTDFLRALLPHLRDPRTGLAQARWGHLNHRESFLTRAQSIGIDGHFAVEQTARSANHLFLNFNGTAGLWRRACIEDAGGWQADTLTEDLDLSYRAQLRGWHLEYVPDVVVPAELPDTYTAFKSQQFRWAKGSIQTALKLLPQVVTSGRSRLAKLQSFFHLCHYLAHPLMLTVALLALPVLGFFGGHLHPGWLAVLGLPLVLATAGPTVLYTVSQRHLYRDDWRRRVLLLPALVLVGFGICLSNTRAVVEALLGVKSGFVRTPKKGTATARSYRTKPNVVPLLEIGAGLYTLLTLALSLRAGHFGLALFFTFYVGGFLLVGISSLREQYRPS